MAVTIITDTVAGRSRRWQTAAVIPPQHHAGLLTHNQQGAVPGKSAPLAGSAYLKLIDTEMLRVDHFATRLIQCAVITCGTGKNRMVSAEERNRLL